MLSTQKPYLIHLFLRIARTADSSSCVSTMKPAVCVCGCVCVCMRARAERAGSVRLVHRIAALMGTHRSTLAISITV